MKYKYLPMVVSNLNFDNFGWTRKHREIDSYWLHSKVNSKNKNYVYFDPKDNWFLGYAEIAEWQDFAKHGPKLLPSDSGLGQDKIYGEILHNIKKLKGQLD